MLSAKLIILFTKMTTTIEIEDYDGNTLCYFNIKANVKSDNITLSKNLELADDDEDYFKLGGSKLIRLQLNEKK
jgi:hypothetical protein